MTTTLRRHRTIDIPEYVYIAQMDRARRMVEDAQRLHDQLAYEVGFERVRIHHIERGDVIASNKTGEFYEVVLIQHKVDPSGIGEWFNVVFADAGGQCEYEADELVSRQLPQIDEAF